MRWTTCVGFAFATFRAAAKEDSSTAHERLLKWIIDYSGSDEFTQNVSLGTFERGGMQVRGLRAERNFAEGEVVLKVPEELWLYSDKVAKHLSKNCHALYLATERRKGAESWWYPYIQVMPVPEDYDQFMLSYADESLLESYTQLPPAEASLSTQETWRKQWAQCQRYDEAKNVTFDDFRWAKTASQTRSWDSEHGWVMVPLADMANTDLNTNMYWPGMVSFELLADRDIAKGEELTVWYGNHKNDYFLEVYGLTLDNNWAGIPKTRRPCIESPALKETPRQERIHRAFENLRQEFCNRVDEEEVVEAEETEHEGEEEEEGEQEYDEAEEDPEGVDEKEEEL